MTEQSFHQIVDKLFLTLEAWIESSGTTLDFETTEGILTVFLPEGSQLILSRQTALQEIWLASPLGAYHFHHTGEGWVTRQGQPLLATMANIIQQQADVTIDVMKVNQEE